jgi:ankyrin repeat domain-containing protein 50
VRLRSRFFRSAHRLSPRAARQFTGHPTYLPTYLLDVYSTLTCCGSLVTVNEEELTIRLIHHSVKQFLLSWFKDLTDITFTMGSANRRMADIIVTYLSYGIFETQLSTVVVPQIMTGSAPSRIISSTMDPSSNVRSLALKLLKFRKQPNYDISKTLAEARKHFQSSSVDEFHFYSYAKSYWLPHNWYISDQDLVMYNLLLKLFKGNAVDMDAMDEDGRTPLLWAATKGYAAAVELLLDSGRVDAGTNARDKDGRTLLLWAAAKGHEAVVKLLLDSGKVDADAKDSEHGRTPLSWAATNGHEAVVKLLLDSGKVDVDVKDTKYGRTPLSYAARNGDKAVVKLLLDSGKVDVDTKDSEHGRMPLSWATLKGHKAIVELLRGKRESDRNLFPKELGLKKDLR